MRSDNGYSFIELIVIVAALMLIAAFGLARYNEFNERQTVQQTAENLISNLRLIQAKALAGDKPAGCTTLVGYTVVFDLKSYTMYAVCDPEGIIDTTRVTVDLPGNVNFNPLPDPVTYYTAGRGTSGDQDVQVVGRLITIPVVLSANTIAKGIPIQTTIAVATPTPTPYSCPWPAGDPRCGAAPPPAGETATPTPTQPAVGSETYCHQFTPVTCPAPTCLVTASCPQCKDTTCHFINHAVSSPTPILTNTPTNTPTPTGTAQFACEASGGTWTGFTDNCADNCWRYSNNIPPSCLQVPIISCDCGTSQCWDGATCVSNP